MGSDLMSLNNHKLGVILTTLAVIYTTKVVVFTTFGVKVIY